MNGVFITFEGIDGCGKSTQLSKAFEYLREKTDEVVVTREPGGTDISESIREMLLSGSNRGMCEKCELMLYFAARAQHVSEKIAPLLKESKIVLCDRFSEATFAYQGYGRGFNLKTLMEFNDFSAGGIRPSCTFLFDIDVATAQKRLNNEGRDALDRMELNSAGFFKKVRRGYLDLAEKDSGRFVVLDGRESADRIFSWVRENLDRLLNI